MLLSEARKPTSHMTPGLYFSHPVCLEHDPSALSPEHPDTPERLIELERVLSEQDWLGWERRPAPQASIEQLELVHTRRHVDRIRDICAGGGGAIDPDTFVGEASFRAALHAAGGACAMTQALLGGQAQSGFCAVRPSGHHAESGQAMGFCLFNNVAVAAADAIARLGVERVFVLDWDVHHGNGTQEIFSSRPDVLFASLHQAGLYPGTGTLAECGTGAGEGYTINMPVPAGSQERLWLSLLDNVILPAAGAFEPQLVLVSAGYDAHELDPLADCSLRTETFPQMALRVLELARSAGAPLGVVMEGGYNKRVLAQCVSATLPALAGHGEMIAQGEGSAERVQEITERAIAAVSRHWPL